jgi:uroporphyrinogen decarboxylase
METALMNMAANPELYLAVDEKVTNFYLRANEFIYETCKDLGDAVIFANDFGSQIGLLISKKMIHDYVMPSSRKLVEQAHAYGKKVIYHSCGAVMDAYDEMLGIGVDVIHPVQVTAKGVDIRKIKEQYGDRASFCGAVDIQYLLPNGTPEEVKATVRELREIFPTGLVISPSQGVLLDDVPPANIQAMLEAAKEIY